LIKPVKSPNDNNYVPFASKLESYHDFIHVWVGGMMSNIQTAVNDPVFFLNHCNVDRLWAMWQDYGNANSFPQSGQSYGNNRTDNIWPWDGGKAMPESDRLRDIIRKADKDYIVKNESMLDYRVLRYCYDTFIGELKTKVPQKATINTTGGGHIFELNITTRANYRIYTSGTTDVQMEVFGPALCNNCFGQLRARDDNSGDGGINPSVSITLAPGKYYIVIRSSHPTDKGAYELSCNVYDDPIKLTLEKPFRATLSAMWEIDWYIFDITEQGNYLMETTGQTDTMMLLYGPNPPTDLIARDDNSGSNKNALIKHTLKVGRYHIAIRSSANTTGKYSVVVRR